MNPRKLFRLKLYPVIDAAMRARAARFHATCRGEGCDACCYQVVYVTPTEADVLAARIARDPAAPAIIGKLRELALYVQRFGPSRKTSAVQDEMDRVGYWNGHQPCAFLEAGRCTVYEDRPIACRTHMSVDPPEKCGESSGTRIGYIDATDIMLEQVRLSGELDGGKPLIGPLANAVLYALRPHVAYHKELRELVEHACEGVLSLRQWAAVVFPDHFGGE